MEGAGDAGYAEGHEVMTIIKPRKYKHKLIVEFMDDHPQTTMVTFLADSVFMEHLQADGGYRLECHASECMACPVTVEAWK